jgi:hypothetical protein
LAGVSRHVATGNSRYGEGDVLAVPALHKTGATISIEFTIVLLRDASNAIIAIVAIIREVTKRFEELRQLKRRLAESSVAETTKVPS